MLIVTILCKGQIAAAPRLPTLHVAHAERGKEYDILFRVCLFCICIHLEYVRIVGVNPNPLTWCDLSPPSTHLLWLPRLRRRRPAPSHPLQQRRDGFWYVVYIYAYTHTHTHIYIYRYLSIYLSIYIYIYIYIHISMYLCIYVCIYVSIYLYISG